MFKKIILGLSISFFTILLFVGIKLYNKLFVYKVSGYSGYGVEQITHPVNKPGVTPMYEHRAVVIYYHDVTSLPSKSEMTISTQQFIDDLNTLIENNFNIIPLSKLERSIVGKDTIPPNAVVITFDDGKRNFYTDVYPILKRYSVPAADFLITSKIKSEDNSDNGNTPFLNKAMVKEMLSSKLVEVGSHTDNLHRYIDTDMYGDKDRALVGRQYDPEKKRVESQREYTNRVYRDLSQSRRTIKTDYGIDCDTLSFPYGAYNEEVIRIAKKAGYKFFTTTTEGVSYEGSYYNIIVRVDAGKRELTPEKLIREIEIVSRGPAPKRSEIYRLLEGRGKLGNTSRISNKGCCFKAKSPLRKILIWKWLKINGKPIYDGKPCGIKSQGEDFALRTSDRKVYLFIYNLKIHGDAQVHKTKPVS